MEFFESCVLIRNIMAKTIKTGSAWLLKRDNN